MTHAQKSLVDEIIDQEAISAKLRGHRLGDPAEMSERAQYLADHAPAGMTPFALRWVYKQQRCGTSARMTPAHMHRLYARFRAGHAVSIPSIPVPPSPPHLRYSTIITHRLFRALGMRGNSELAPLMPGDLEILDRPPTRDEADDFYALPMAPRELSAWLASPVFPYAEFPRTSTSQDPEWWE